MWETHGVNAFGGDRGQNLARQTHTFLGTHIDQSRAPRAVGLGTHAAPHGALRLKNFEITGIGDESQIQRHAPCPQRLMSMAHTWCDGQRLPSQQIYSTGPASQDSHRTNQAQIQDGNGVQVITQRTVISGPPALHRSHLP